MKLVVMVALLTIALSNAYAEELLGIQNVKCGGKIFKATSITTVSPTELVDTKGITHDVRSDGIGQGGHMNGHVFVLTNLILYLEVAPWSAYQIWNRLISMCTMFLILHKNILCELAR